MASVATLPVRDPEAAVLDFLRRAEETSPTDLLEELECEGFDATLIREAIWRLVSDHVIEFSPERKLLISRQPAR